MIRPTLGRVSVLGAAFLGGAFANFVLTPLGQPSVLRAGSPLPDAPTVMPTEAGLEQFDRVITKVGPAVVTVDSVRAVASSNSALKSKPTEESGSGVLIRLSGLTGTYAFTNNHVVGGANASDVTVTLSDGRIVQPSQVWADPESDVAVLKLDADNLPTLEFANSDTTKLGQWVLAFGSPFGLQQTVTHGIISARNRGQISLGNTIRIKEFIQTDAPINPGNSGGPLVNLAGDVIGINTAIATNNGANSGISFSIPANLVQRIARELLEKGTVTRGYLGLQLAPTLEPSVALRLGLNRVAGALVEGVHSDGPAARAGLAARDVILKLNTVEIRDENHLINLVSALPVQQQVTLTVWRARQERTLTVTIGDWSQAVAGRQ